MKIIKQYEQYPISWQVEVPNIDNLYNSPLTKDSELFVIETPSTLSY